MIFTSKLIGSVGGFMTKRRIILPVFLSGRLRTKPGLLAGACPVRCTSQRLYQRDAARVGI